MQEEFSRLQARSAWMTSYSIRGHVYGSGFNHDQDVRPPHFFQLATNARRILELGSCQGGGTFQLARHAGVREVVALEGRDYNIEKAKFVQQTLGVSNVKFLEANLETFDFASLGRFDAVYCVGLLYHLPSPWELLARLEPVADVLYINTHYCRQAQASMTIDGYEGLKYGEQGFADPLSGLSSWSFWPTLKSLAHMLIDTGFTPEIVETDSTGPGQSPHGTTILARRTAALRADEKERLLLKMHELLARQPAVEACAARGTFAARLSRAFARLKRAGHRAWRRSAS